MIQTVGWGWTIFFFLLGLGPLVFFHELGHYLVARWCGVKADVFSIGFGREVFGWTDTRGTRWKVGWLPLGGYVRFVGDANASSQPDESWKSLAENERKVSLPAQPVWKRMLIVAAGPVANFLLAFVIYTGMFASLGQVVRPPVVGAVLEGSVAAKAGLRPGDRFVSIDGRAIADFRDVSQIVSANGGQMIEFRIERGGSPMALTVAPAATIDRDKFGNEFKVGRIGVAPTDAEIVDLPLWKAPVVAAQETANNTGMLVYGLWQLVTGRQSVKELGGPLMIAKASGEVATGGVVAFLAFLAFLSINLGFINLLPVPVLDGGHLVFYSVEAVLGKPLSQRAQEMAFFMGFFLLMSLMVFATFNDLTRYGVFNRLAGLIG